MELFFPAPGLLRNGIIKPKNLRMRSISAKKHFSHSGLLWQNISFITRCFSLDYSTINKKIPHGTNAWGKQNLITTMNNQRQKGCRASIRINPRSPSRPRILCRKHQQRRIRVASPPPACPANGRPPSLRGRWRFRYRHRQHAIPDCSRP